MFQVFFLRFIARKVAVGEGMRASDGDGSDGRDGRVSGSSSSNNSNRDANNNNNNCNNNNFTDNGSTNNSSSSSTSSTPLNDSPTAPSHSHILKVYNSSLGRPTAAMHSGMREEYDSILGVSDYEGFFRRISLSYSPAQCTAMLRNAVRSSVRRGYSSVNLKGAEEPEPIPEYGTSARKRERTEDGGNGDDAAKSLPSASESHGGSNIIWEDVWKTYEKERAAGKYSDEKLSAIRR